jgi:hypothetical protein
MASIAVVVLGLFVAAPSAQLSLETMKSWFESDAAAIMNSLESSRLGVFNSSVEDVSLDDCVLSWTDESSPRVHVPLKDIETESLRLESSMLLDSRRVFSIRMIGTR